MSNGKRRRRRNRGKMYAGVRRLIARIHKLVVQGGPRWGTCRSPEDAADMDRIEDDIMAAFAFCPPELRGSQLTLAEVMNQLAELEDSWS